MVERLKLVSQNGQSLLRLAGLQELEEALLQQKELDGLGDRRAKKDLDQ